jgi:hypothetical protein
MAVDSTFLADLVTTLSAPDRATVEDLLEAISWS